ncbi:hypothetical protein [Flavobacterium sp. UBA6135]|uniref:hypothetical protein n=1 Tax=Flavobacterium sp. UBA6135 TaxID=1946553 RepID=UPI0025C26649|nr:hypothetical protein [Flavobacterium sp. UBA6135]
MKNAVFFLTILLLFFFSTAVAQNSIRYRVHVDNVYPGKVEVYEVLAKKLADLAAENKEEKEWVMFVSDDFKYHAISPLNSMTEIGINPYSNTLEKMGGEAFIKMFESFDECYPSHGDYILNLSTTLSYMPYGLVNMIDGKDFRTNYLYYYEPKDFDAVLKTAEQFKTLNEKKKSKLHYRIYLSGFGNPEAYILISYAASNEEELKKMVEENNKLLGEERVKLNDALNANTFKMETRRGTIRRDLSYIK